MHARRLAILGTRGIPARYGGFETFAQEISWRLAEAGLDVTVFCEDEGPEQYRGVRLRYVPTLSLGPFSTLLFDLRSLWRARRGYDVVYMLGYGAALFCFIPRLWGAQVWINMDGVEWRRSKWSRAARLWLKCMEWIATRTASRLIVDSSGIGAHLRGRYRSLPAMTMIPYGVDVVAALPDPAPLADHGLRPGGYCLIVCRLEPENHILEIIRGYESLTTELPLVVVGGLQPGSAYCAELERHRSGRIRFVGTIYDREALWSLRCHCRIYFHGHSVGGTNPSLLEAMAAGNPVVAHDNPFNREVLGPLGEYFSGATDLAVPAQRLLDLAPAAREHLSAEIRERARHEYPWSRIRSAYLKLLGADEDSDRTLSTRDRTSRHHTATVP